jgi:hypothetical protein
MFGRSSAVATSMASTEFPRPLGRALKQVRAAGEKARTVRYYSDPVEIDLGEPESAAESNPWLGDLKVTKQ